MLCSHLVQCCVHNVLCNAAVHTDGCGHKQAFNRQLMTFLPTVLQSFSSLSCTLDLTAYRCHNYVYENFLWWRRSWKRENRIYAHMQKTQRPWLFCHASCQPIYRRWIINWTFVSLPLCLFEVSFHSRGVFPCRSQGLLMGECWVFVVIWHL